MTRPTGTRILHALEAHSHHKHVVNPSFPKHMGQRWSSNIGRHTLHAQCLRNEEEVSDDASNFNNKHPRKPVSFCDLLLVENQASKQTARTSGASEKGLKSLRSGTPPMDTSMWFLSTCGDVVHAIAPSIPVITIHVRTCK